MFENSNNFSNFVFQVRNRLRKDLTNMMQDHYGLGQTNATEMFVDRIQQSFQCCGVNGPADWINSRLNNPSG